MPAGSPSTADLAPQGGNTARVLITGASSGIGRALALAYAREGASLVLLGRDAERLGAAANACLAAGAEEAETYVADVRDREAMARIIEAAQEKRPLDILVANAGVSTGLSPGQIVETPEAVRAMFAINVAGVFNTVEPAIAPMCARKSGRIAIVGSMAGVRSLPYSPAYCAAKAATHMWADSLRGALAPHGVSVSLIVPGFVKTPMTAALKAWQPGAVSDQRAALIIKRGLERRRPVIAFPLFIYAAMRFFALLPPAVVDGVMRRFHVDVPETPERELS
ncbi:MAG: SDR family NAD(P)-dependent oxidoreductase [Alphaproteobacteria bacterium]|nr:SDR family NAD(P)-dependent oxidoreductase [Alphaproteobacteria bacterium]MBM3653488.1 SDR family NAD(P)-dependent oxidoreductase [Alphaproteobacteria bacterium]